MAIPVGSLRTVIYVLLAGNHWQRINVSIDMKVGLTVVGRVMAGKSFG